MKNVQENFQIISCQVKNHRSYSAPIAIIYSVPEVKNHRSYSAPSLLFFIAKISDHLSYSARFSISFIWHSGVVKDLHNRIRQIKCLKDLASFGVEPDKEEAPAAANGAG